MKWSDQSGAVTPTAVVTEAVAQSLINKPNMTRVEVSGAILPTMQAMFGDEATPRGVHDQVCAVFDTAIERADEGSIDVLSHVSLVNQEIPQLDDVHLVYWAPQNGVKVYFQCVASRLYGKQMAPWNSVSAGDVIVGKMAQRPVFGFTSVEQVVNKQIIAVDEEELAAKVNELRMLLTDMASHIDTDAKLLVEDTVDSAEYWNGTAKFAEESRGSLVSYATLVTFAPWREFKYPGTQEVSGHCYVDYKVGQGPAASWWSGGPIVANLSTNCTWKPPCKRGRKKKAQVTAQV